MEISLAPMFRITKPSFRLLIRILNDDVLLFTEIITDAAINNADDTKLRRILGPAEIKTVVQVGGSNPENVANAVYRLVGLGYSMFNLNCGCPSNKVQKGLFGAILMKHTENVVNIINRVYEKTGKILSVKTRIGVDEYDTYEFFKNFVVGISQSTPCRKFYIHARKCWLKGLDPKANRNIPALNYEFVYRIKEEHPELAIILNGGISQDNALVSICNLDGIMIGRAAIADILIFNSMFDKKEIDLEEKLIDYFNECKVRKYRKQEIFIPLINLYKCTPYNKKYKSLITNIVTENKDVVDEDCFSNVIEFLKEHPRHKIQ